MRLNRKACSELNSGLRHQPINTLYTSHQSQHRSDHIDDRNSLLADAVSDSKSVSLIAQFAPLYARVSRLRDDTGNTFGSVKIDSHAALIKQ